MSGGGISQQAYALRHRITEVDTRAAASAVPVTEMHAEASSPTLAGVPLLHPTKGWAGVALRRGLPPGSGITGAHAAIDDVYDATVAAWPAHRRATSKSEETRLSVVKASKTFANMARWGPHMATAVAMGGHEGG